MHTTENQKLATRAGFELCHTGGGCMAFRKDGPGKYWLITEEDGMHVGGDPEQAIWSVGCYNDDQDDENAEYLWVDVQEPVTLRDALRLHSNLPEPTQFEQTIEKWSDLGIEISTGAASKP